MSIVQPSSPARNECETPVPGGRATTWPGRSAMLLVRRTPFAPCVGDGHRWSVADALEDDEDLLLLRVAVRAPSPSCPEQAAPRPSPRAPCRSRWREARPTSGRPQLSSSTSSTLRMFVGPRRGLAVGERRRAGLDVPRIVVAALDPRPADPDRARAGQPADLGRVARAEDEEVEPVGAGDERVLEVVGALDHAVAGTHLVHLAVLPGEAGAAEHVVDLLRGAVRVRRRRQPARRDADAVHARRRFVPAARPSVCQIASISPFARRWRSTSSQCASPTPGD